MGLFGNLFSKKVCAICGEEIGMFGNRKLEDGNCCKNCAAKLSPWFDERRHSTVDQIKQQLEYREANKEKVANFQITRQLGNGTKVLFDENAGTFAVVNEYDTGKLAEVNPDIILCSQATSCEVKIDEMRNEVYQRVTNSEGETENKSYSPRRYRYSYKFKVKITVNHPYFDDISFDLSRGYIEIHYNNYSSGLLDALFSDNIAGGEGTTSAPPLSARRNDPEYAQCERMGEEIRQMLMNRNSKPQPEAFQGAAPQQPEVPQQPVYQQAPQPQPEISPTNCPNCGAPLRPGAKFCESCGSKL